MYRLAIFDFDGTLVDSAPGIVEVMRDVCKEYKFSDKTLELWSHLIGVPLLRQVEILFPEHPPEFHREVAQRYRDIYDTKAIEICPPFDGLEEMLQKLREAEILISIASSKRRHLIDTVLEFHSLTEYFCLVVGAEEVTKHKPDPEPVLISLQQLNVAVADSVVIGDSSYDLDMARNAG
ncbi:MAG: HAD family hydrolase, partial [Candidatus Obscuribacterales bacterium]|nr:HAD family hydrolase [Candidatus Obscuribacterales bacterium]